MANWVDRWDESNFGLAQFTAVADELLERAQEDSSFSISALPNFTPPIPIVHLATSKETIIVGLENGSIARLRGEDIEVIEISPKTRVHKVFIDASATHVIISMVNEENYYLFGKWTKALRISRFRGIIESLCWDKNTSESSAYFLFGTRSGALWEACLEPKEGLLATPALTEKTMKQLYVFVTPEKDKDGHALPAPPITGLAKESIGIPEISATGISNTTLYKHFIMVSTPGKIFTFLGGPTYESVFQNQTQDLKPLAILPTIGSNPIYSELHFFLPKAGSVAKSFAWLGNPGIYCGDFVFGIQNLSQSGGPGGGIISDARLCELKPPPRSCVLTEFHYIVLWPDKLQAISRITQEPVYEHKFKKTNTAKFQGISASLSNPGELIGLAQDPVLGSILAYNSSTIYMVELRDEDKNVWSQYLKVNQFHLALEYAKTPKQKDSIYIKRADHHFEAGQYNLSGQYYALSSKSFEEIVLKFIEKNQQDALRTFLTHKLKVLPKSDSTQQTLIATWLTELYLDKLNSLTSALPALTTSTRGQADQIQLVLDEFYAFLEESQDKLDGTTALHMMASHGRVQELLTYANSIKKDHHRVIQYYLQTKQWKNALQVLSSDSQLHRNSSTAAVKPGIYPNNTIASKKDVKETKLDPNLYYKYCPLLIEHLPTETVDLLIHTQDLNPRFLIPALMRYQRSQESLYGDNGSSTITTTNKSGIKVNEAIRYLEFIVNKQGNKDPAIHNYLLSLYIQQPDEKPLLSFLKQKDTIVDLQYALRLCSKKGKVQAQVLIFSKMKLYEEAVNLALGIPDITLANSIADKPKEDNSLKESDSDELRKRLWLHIARYVVETEKQIKKATTFLKDCPLLKIEDILPFFPDFVLIDDFQEEICGSLRAYNKHLESLQEEMSETTESAELIREDFKNIKTHFSILNFSTNPTTNSTALQQSQQQSPSSRCTLCKFTITTSGFYLFPCSHAFHCKCLQTEMKKHLTEKQLQEVKSIEEKLAMLHPQTSTMATTVTTTTSTLFSDDNDLAPSFLSILTSPQPLSTFSPEPQEQENNPDLGVDDMVGRSYQYDKEQQLLDQLDAIIACECPLCGSCIIKDVDEPFVEPGSAEFNSWKIQSVTFES